MSSTKKALTALGLAVAGAVALYLIYLNNRTDPPIMIGDSSVYFHSDGITKNSDTELEASKFLHKVFSIVVVDATSGTSSSAIDVKGRDWILMSANNTVSVTPDPQLFGLQAGVKGDCPTPWQGSAMDYTCVPTDGSKLTPATLTFKDGNCPGTLQPSCPLACTSGKCIIQLVYH